MSTNPLLEAAQGYVEVGLSVIPVSVRTKKPTAKWKVFQKHLPTEGEIKRGFAQADGLAIVCGAVSGNLEIFDFDFKAELFPDWERLVEDECPGLLSRLGIQKSQNLGRHAGYRCPGLIIPGNQTFAQRPIDVGEEVGRLLLDRGVNFEDEFSVKRALNSIEVTYGGKKYRPRLIDGRFIIVITLIESRGDGGYFLAHPTPGYELLQGDLHHIPAITPEERQILINAAIALNEYVDPGKVEGLGYRLPTEAHRPGDDFNQHGNVAEILIKHGWRQVGARANYQHFRRPGKDRGQSASLIDGKWFHVFTTNGLPFDSEKTYSPFGVYALLECHGDFIKAASILAKLGFGDRKAKPELAAATSGETPWELAARLFPRVPFPWEVLPARITESLQQLARSCATSPNPLPGAAFCQMASILGRTLTVSPKKSWNAPLIIWHADIRASGEGKTPPPRLMAGPIQEAQNREAKRYKQELEIYKSLPRKKRDQEPPPAPPRGYFVSDLTLEGLREDLDNSPHGGIIVIQDEISAFITGQNQYKARGGTDREAWLALYDGHPARVKRVGKEVYLYGARVSIFGGIQPRVFRTYFAGSNGLYLDDGTLYRFLTTFEPPTFYEATPESWEDHHRERWEGLLLRATDWAEEKILAQDGLIEKPIRMILDSEAQQKFFKWQNEISSFKIRLPAQIRGFLPKAVEYCLRLTGIIHCMHRFSMGGTPQAILTVEDLDRGIKTVHFYLGQVQAALRLIENEDFVPMEISERSLLLARTLDQLRPQLDNGRLAIGYIQEEYNKIAPKTKHIGSARAMGAWLRSVLLTITPGKHDANGRRAVHCLEWNQKTEKFIKQSLQSLQSLQKQEGRWFEDADIENPMSAMSASPTERVGSAQTLQTSEIQSLQPETCASSGLEDIADLGVKSEGNGGAPESGPVQCAECQHFAPSPVGPGRKGYCRLHANSWDGQIFQPPYDIHPCPSFWGKGFGDRGAQAEPTETGEKRHQESIEDADHSQG